MVSHPWWPLPNQPRYLRVYLAPLHLLHVFARVDICRHIAAAGAASGMLLVCAAGPMLVLHHVDEPPFVQVVSKCCI
jgi:hypothetical protein